MSDQLRSMGDGFRELFRLQDLPDGQAKGFAGPPGSFIGLVAVRRGDDVHVFQNACPHIGTPLDWMPDKFLSADGRYLVCATHGAMFTIDSGECIAGPCRGDFLEPIDTVIRDGIVCVRETT